MEVSELIKAFEDHNDEFLKFDRIPIDRRYSNRPDLNAFMLLDDLLTADNSDMVSAAEHEEIYLQPSLEVLSEIAQVEDVIDLIRCGVMLDKGTDSLKMFV